MNNQVLATVLVEDDPDEKDIFIAFLKDRTDIELREFFESGPALTGYLGDLPDVRLPKLIVLDHNMPRVTGFQVLQELKNTERFRRIPVVIYSTYVNAGLAERCIRAGALAVFTKPLTKAGYDEMMDKVLKKMNQP